MERPPEGDWISILFLYTVTSPVEIQPLISAMHAVTRLPTLVGRTKATHEQLVRICQNGRADSLYQSRAQATGYAQLDTALPGGGFPIGAVTEVMPQVDGIGELRVVMPALASIMRTERYVAFIEPPFLLYPPALVQQGLLLERLVIVHNQSLSMSLWASEQLLRCSAFGAVLLWTKSIHDKELRRLQLAAEAGSNLAILYRPVSAANTSSPAALRLRLSADDAGLLIEIKKCRGGHAGQIVRCAFQAA